MYNKEFYFLNFNDHLFQIIWAVFPLLFCCIVWLMAQGHHRVKPRLHCAAQAAVGAPNHSFSERTQELAISAA